MSSSQEVASFSRRNLETICAFGHKTTRITKQLRVHQINILELWRVKSSDHNLIQDPDPGSKPMVRDFETTLISSVSVFLQFFRLNKSRNQGEGFKNGRIEHFPHCYTKTYAKTLVLP